MTFPGVHHAMASSEYPGWLFAQQVGTITQQLHAGVRALNIDTHYGAPSTARIPGQDTPIILTDNVATVAGRAENDQNPVAAKRAAQLAAGAPKAADASVLQPAGCGLERSTTEMSEGSDTRGYRLCSPYRSTGRRGPRSSANKSGRRQTTPRRWRTDGRSAAARPNPRFDSCV